MLNMKVNNDALVNVEQIAQNETDVARPVPLLVPVAYVQEDGEGIYSRSAAALYFTPDEKSIVRFPSDSGNQFYDYDRVTQVPETHPVWAALKDPGRKTGEQIIIPQSQEGRIGEPADPSLVQWFKSILEPQLQKDYAEFRKAQGLKP